MEPSEYIHKKLVEEFGAWQAVNTKLHTQKKLADDIGVNQGQISVWLKGGAVPGANSLYALAKGMGISAYRLLPPDGSLLGGIILRLAKLDEAELRALLPFVENAKAVAAQGLGTSEHKKLADNDG